MFIILSDGPRFDIDDSHLIWQNSSNIKCPISATSVSECHLGPWNNTCDHLRDTWITCDSMQRITGLDHCLLLKLQLIILIKPKYTAFVSHFDGFSLGYY